MDPACDELACSQPEGEDSKYGCRAGGVSTQSVPTSRTSAERCGTGCASSDTVRWRTGAGGGAELTRRQHGRPFCASFCSAGRFCGTGGSYARGDHHICSGCSAIFARIDAGATVREARQAALYSQLAALAPEVLRAKALSLAGVKEIEVAAVFEAAGATHY